MDVNVILETLADAFQGERETMLFDALEDTFYGLVARRRVKKLHDYALRVQSNVRELAKQRVRLPDQVQGFLSLRRVNLSTHARIAIMTLAGNSLSFEDVKKACKRHADEFLREPKEHSAHKSHAINASQQKKEGLQQKNKKEILTW